MSQANVIEIASEPDFAAKKEQRAGIFFGTAGCIPELGIDRENAGCRGVNDAILAYLTSMPSIHTVILAGRWGLWAEGSPYRHEGGPPVSLVDTSGDPMDRHAAVAAGLERAVSTLTAAGKKVWLVGPIPEIGYDVPRTLYFDSLGIPRSFHLRPTFEEFKDRQRFVLTLFSVLAQKYHVGLLWPHQYLCDARFCRVQEDGHPLYVDDQHLTRSAAISMAAIFDPIFAGSVPGRPEAKSP